MGARPLRDRPASGGRSSGSGCSSTAFITSSSVRCFVSSIVSLPAAACGEELATLIFG